MEPLSWDPTGGGLSLEAGFEWYRLVCFLLSLCFLCVMSELPSPAPVARPCLSRHNGLYPSAASCKPKQSLSFLGRICLWYFIKPAGKELTRSSWMKLANPAVRWLTAATVLLTEAQAPGRRNTLINQRLRSLWFPDLLMGKWDVLTACLELVTFCTTRAVSRGNATGASQRDARHCSIIKHSKDVDSCSLLVWAKVALLSRAADKQTSGDDCRISETE